MDRHRTEAAEQTAWRAACEGGWRDRGRGSGDERGQHRSPLPTELRNLRTLLRRIFNAEKVSSTRIPDASCWRSLPPKCYLRRATGQRRGRFNGTYPGPCPALKPLGDGFSLEVSRCFGRQEGVLHH